MSEGVSLELLSGLSTEDFHDLVGAIRGPDMRSTRKAKTVFTGLIRHLVEPGIVDYRPNMVVRNTPLGKEDITGLYEEMMRWAAWVEQETDLGYRTGRAFAHFFDHVRSAMRVLLGFGVPLTEEEEHEVKALAILANRLKGLFRYASLYKEGSTASTLGEYLQRWAAEWYPDWGTLSIG